MFQTVLYVLRSNMRPEDVRAEVSQMVEAATRWNPTRGVSGVLIVTNEYAAHLLEGPPAAIDEILDYVSRDARVKDLRVVFRRDIPKRTILCWRIGYRGAASFVDRYIADVYVLPAKKMDYRLAVDALGRLLKSFGAKCSEAEKKAFAEACAPSEFVEGGEPPEADQSSIS